MSGEPMILHTTYRNAGHTDALDSVVAEEAAKLERFYRRIVSCRVLIERPHRRRGAPFHVRIELAVPGEELVISSAATPHAAPPEDEAPRLAKGQDIDAPHKNGQLAVRDAFRKAERRLRDYVRRRGSS